MTNSECISSYDHTSDLLLVNAGHPISNYDPPRDLVCMNESRRCIFLRRKVAALLQKLLRDIHGQSLIIPISGWRSIQEQQDIWELSIRENGEDFTHKYVALPGCSEHHTGLAVDMALAKDEIDEICPDFPYSGIAQTFRMKAPSYGFIERYPKGKEAITYIHHEPWHFRYVGIPHAILITEKGITLEEYWNILEENHESAHTIKYRTGDYLFEIGYLTTTRLYDGIRAGKI